MGRHQQFLKFVAIFVIMCLLAQDVALAAQTVSRTAYNVQSTEKGDLPSTIYDVPERLGAIDESFEGSNGKHVTFILDAHDSLDAQKNIVRLIQRAVSTQGVQTVFEEGYEGELNTDKWFGGIQDPQIKRKVSYYYLDQLKIGAAEFAHINRSEIRNQKSEPREKRESVQSAESWRLIGADDKTAYLENVRAFGDSENVRDQILRNTQAIQRELKNLSQKNFSDEARKWILDYQRFHENSLPLMDYLNRWLPRLSSEQAPLLRRILNAAQDLEIAQSIQKTRAAEVLTEVEGFERALEALLFKDSAVKEIWQAMKTMSAIERLAELKISNQDLRHLKNNLKAFKTENLARQFARAKKNPIVLSKRWETLIQNAMKFYELAHKRDQAVERALIAWRDQSKAYNVQRTTKDDLRSTMYDQNSNAVLVFGGFHREGITEILRRNGFSYTVIIPKIVDFSKRHQKIYRQVMAVGVPRTTSHGPRNIIQAARPLSNFYDPAFGSEIRAAEQIIKESPGRDLSSSALLLHEKLSTTAARGIDGEKLSRPSGSPNTRRLLSSVRSEARQNKTSDAVFKQEEQKTRQLLSRLEGYLPRLEKWIGEKKLTTRSAQAQNKAASEIAALLNEYVTDYLRQKKKVASVDAFRDSLAKAVQIWEIETHVFTKGDKDPSLPGDIRGDLESVRDFIKIMRAHLDAGRWKQLPAYYDGNHIHLDKVENPVNRPKRRSEMRAIGASDDFEKHLAWVEEPRYLDLDDLLSLERQRQIKAELKNKDQSGKLKIAFVVPSAGSASFLRSTLSRFIQQAGKLRKLQPHWQIQIFVVSNGDESEKQNQIVNNLKESAQKYEIVLHGLNSPKAGKRTAALNTGAAAARMWNADILSFIDDDIEINALDMALSIKPLIEREKVFLTGPRAVSGKTKSEETEEGRFLRMLYKVIKAFRKVPFPKMPVGAALFLPAEAYPELPAETINDDSFLARFFAKSGEAAFERILIPDKAQIKVYGVESLSEFFSRQKRIITGARLNDEYFRNKDLRLFQDENKSSRWKAFYELTKEYFLELSVAQKIRFILFASRLLLGLQRVRREVRQNISMRRQAGLFPFAVEWGTAMTTKPRSESRVKKTVEELADEAEKLIREEGDLKAWWADNIENPDGVKDDTKLWGRYSVVLGKVVPRNMVETRGLLGEIQRRFSEDADIPRVQMQMNRLFSDFLITYFQRMIGLWNLALERLPKPTQDIYNAIITQHNLRGPLHSLLTQLGLMSIAIKSKRATKEENIHTAREAEKGIEEKLSALIWFADLMRLPEAGKPDPLINFYRSYSKQLAPQAAATVYHKLVRQVAPEQITPEFRQAMTAYHDHLVEYRDAFKFMLAQIDAQPSFRSETRGEGKASIRSIFHENHVFWIGFWIFLFGPLDRFFLALREATMDQEDYWQALNWLNDFTLPMVTMETATAMLLVFFPDIQNRPEKARKAFRKILFAVPLAYAAAEIMGPFIIPRGDVGHVFDWADLAAITAAGITMRLLHSTQLPQPKRSEARAKTSALELASQKIAKWFQLRHFDKLAEFDWENAGATNRERAEKLIEVSRHWENRHWISLGSVALALFVPVGAILLLTRETIWETWLPIMLIVPAAALFAQQVAEDLLPILLQRHHQRRAHRLLARIAKTSSISGVATSDMEKERAEARSEAREQKAIPARPANLAVKKFDRAPAALKHWVVKGEEEPWGVLEENSPAFVLQDGVLILTLEGDAKYFFRPFLEQTAGLETVRINESWKEDGKIRFTVAKKLPDGRLAVKGFIVSDETEEAAAGAKKKIHVRKILEVKENIGGRVAGGTVYPQSVTASAPKIEKPLTGLSVEKAAAPVAAANSETSASESVWVKMTAREKLAVLAAFPADFDWQKPSVRLPSFKEKEHLEKTTERGYFNLRVGEKMVYVVTRLGVKDKRDVYVQSAEAVGKRYRLVLGFSGTDKTTTLWMGHFRTRAFDQAANSKTGTEIFEILDEETWTEKFFAELLLKPDGKNWEEVLRPFGNEISMNLGKVYQNGFRKIKLGDDLWAEISVAPHKYAGYSIQVVSVQPEDDLLRVELFLTSPDGLTNVTLIRYVASEKEKAQSKGSALGKEVFYRRLLTEADSLDLKAGKEIVRKTKREENAAIFQTLPADFIATLSPLEQKVVAQLAQNPKISNQEIANASGSSQPSVSAAIQRIRFKAKVKNLIPKLEEKTGRSEAREPPKPPAPPGLPVFSGTPARPRPPVIDLKIFEENKSEAISEILRMGERLLAKKKTVLDEEKMKKMMLGDIYRLRDLMRRLEAQKAVQKTILNQSAEPHVKVPDVHGYPQFVFEALKAFAEFNFTPEELQDIPPEGMLDFLITQKEKGKAFRGQITFLGDLFDDSTHPVKRTQEKKGSNDNLLVYEIIKSLKRNFAERVNFVLGNHDVWLIRAFLFEDAEDEQSWKANRGQIFLNQVVNKSNSSHPEQASFLVQMKLMEIALWLLENGRLYFKDELLHVNIHAATPPDSGSKPIVQLEYLDEEQKKIAAEYAEIEKAITRKIELLGEIREKEIEGDSASAAGLYAQMAQISEKIKHWKTAAVFKAPTERVYWQRDWDNFFTNLKNLRKRLRNLVDAKTLKTLMLISPMNLDLQNLSPEIIDKFVEFLPEAIQEKLDEKKTINFLIELGGNAVFYGHTPAKKPKIRGGRFFGIDSWQTGLVIYDPAKGYQWRGTALPRRLQKKPDTEILSNQEMLKQSLRQEAGILKRIAEITGRSEMRQVGSAMMAVAKMRTKEKIASRAFTKNRSEARILDYEKISDMELTDSVRQTWFAKYKLGMVEHALEIIDFSGNTRDARKDVGSQAYGFSLSGEPKGVFVAFPFAQMEGERDNGYFALFDQQGEMVGEGLYSAAVISGSKRKILTLRFQVLPEYRSRGYGRVMTEAIRFFADQLDPEMQLFFHFYSEEINNLTLRKSLADLGFQEIPQVPQMMQLPRLASSRSEARGTDNQDLDRLTYLWGQYTEALTENPVQRSHAGTAFSKWLMTQSALDLGAGAYSFVDTLKRLGNPNTYRMDMKPVRHPDARIYATHLQQSFYNPWPLEDESIKIIYSHWALGGEVPGLYPSAWDMPLENDPDATFANEVKRTLHPDGFAYFELGFEPNPELIRALRRTGLYVQSPPDHAKDFGEQSLAVIVTKKPFADVINQIQGELEANNPRLAENVKQEVKGMRSEARGFFTKAWSLVSSRDARLKVAQSWLEKGLMDLEARGEITEVEAKELLSSARENRDVLVLLEILGVHLILKVTPHPGAFGTTAAMTGLVTGQWWLVPLYFLTGIFRGIATFVLMRKTNLPNRLFLILGSIIPVAGNFSVPAYMLRQPEMRQIGIAMMSVAKMRAKEKAVSYREKIKRPQIRAGWQEFLVEAAGWSVSVGISLGLGYWVSNFLFYSIGWGSSFLGWGVILGLSFYIYHFLLVPRAEVIKDRLFKKSAHAQIEKVMDDIHENVLEKAVNGLKRRNFLRHLAGFGVGAFAVFKSWEIVSERNPMDSPLIRSQTLSAGAQKESGFFKAGVGYDEKTGLTYDGIDFSSSENTPDLSFKYRDWTAPSKEALHLTFLYKALMGDSLARELVGMQENEILNLLNLKIQTYQKLQRENPAWGGFLPWLRIQNGQARAASEWGWGNKLPALDNGQFAWAIWGVMHALREHSAATKTNSAMQILEDQYQKYFDGMARSSVTIFYDNEGRVRGEAYIRDLSKQPGDPANYASDNGLSGADFKQSYFIQDPFEAKQMLWFMDLFGTWSRETDKEAMWQTTLKNLALTTVTLEDGRALTIQKQYKAWPNEYWHMMILPYREVQPAWELFKNTVKYLSHHARESGIPGFFAPIRDLDKDVYTHGHGYPKAALDPESIGTSDIISPAGLMGFLAADRPAAMRWLHLVLSEKLPWLENPIWSKFGSRDGWAQRGTNRDNRKYGMTKTWDGLIYWMPILEASRDYSRWFSENMRKRFVDVENRLYEKVVTDADQIQGRQVEFAEPMDLLAWKKAQTKIDVLAQKPLRLKTDDTEKLLLNLTNQGLRVDYRFTAREQEARGSIVLNQRMAEVRQLILTYRMEGAASKFRFDFKDWDGRVVGQKEITQSGEFLGKSLSRKIVFKEGEWPENVKSLDVVVLSESGQSGQGTIWIEDLKLENPPIHSRARSEARQFKAKWNEDAMTQIEEANPGTRAKILKILETPFSQLVLDRDYDDQGGRSVLIYLDNPVDMVDDQTGLQETIRTIKIKGVVFENEAILPDFNLLRLDPGVAPDQAENIGKKLMESSFTKEGLFLLTPKRSTAEGAMRFDLAQQDYEISQRSFRKGLSVPIPLGLTEFQNKTSDGSSAAAVILGVASVRDLRVTNLIGFKTQAYLQSVAGPMDPAERAALKAFFEEDIVRLADAQGQALRAFNDRGFIHPQFHLGNGGANIDLEEGLVSIYLVDHEGSLERTELTEAQFLGWLVLGLKQAAKRIHDLTDKRYYSGPKLDWTSAFIRGYFGRFAERPEIKKYLSPEKSALFIEDLHAILFDAENTPVLKINSPIVRLLAEMYLVSAAKRSEARNELQFFDEAAERLLAYPKALLHSRGLEPYLDAFDRDHYAWDETHQNWASKDFQPTITGAKRLILGSWEDVQRASPDEHARMKNFVAIRLNTEQGPRSFYAFDDHGWSLQAYAEAHWRGEIPAFGNTQIFIDKHGDDRRVHGGQYYAERFTAMLRQDAGTNNNIEFDMGGFNNTLWSSGFIPKENHYRYHARMSWLRETLTGFPSNQPILLNVDTDATEFIVGEWKNEMPLGLGEDDFESLAVDLTNLRDQYSLTPLTAHFTTTHFENENLADFSLHSNRIQYGDTELARFLARVAPFIYFVKDQPVELRDQAIAQAAREHSAQWERDFGAKFSRSEMRDVFQVPNWNQADFGKNPQMIERAAQSILSYVWNEPSENFTNFRIDYSVWDPNQDDNLWTIVADYDHDFLSGKKHFAEVLSFNRQGQLVYSGHHRMHDGVLSPYLDRYMEPRAHISGEGWMRRTILLLLRSGTFKEIHSSVYGGFGGVPISGSAHKAVLSFKDQPDIQVGAADMDLGAVMYVLSLKSRSEMRSMSADERSVRALRGLDQFVEAIFEEARKHAVTDAELLERLRKLIEKNKSFEEAAHAIIRQFIAQPLLAIEQTPAAFFKQRLFEKYEERYLAPQGIPRRSFLKAAAAFFFAPKLIGQPMLDAAAEAVAAPEKSYILKFDATATLVQAGQSLGRTLGQELSQFAPIFKGALQGLWQNEETLWIPELRTGADQLLMGEALHTVPGALSSSGMPAANYPDLVHGQLLAQKAMNQPAMQAVIEQTRLLNQVYRGLSPEAQQAMNSELSEIAQMKSPISAEDVERLRQRAEELENLGPARKLTEFLPSDFNHEMAMPRNVYLLADPKTKSDEPELVLLTQGSESSRGDSEFASYEVYSMPLSLIDRSRPERKIKDQIRRMTFLNPFGNPLRRGYVFMHVNDQIEPHEPLSIMNSYLSSIDGNITERELWIEPSIERWFEIWKRNFSQIKRPVDGDVLLMYWHEALKQTDEVVKPLREKWSAEQPPIERVYDAVLYYKMVQPEVLLAATDYEVRIAMPALARLLGWDEMAAEIEFDLEQIEQRLRDSEIAHRKGRLYEEPIPNYGAASGLDAENPFGFWGGEDPMDEFEARLGLDSSNRSEMRNDLNDSAERLRRTKLRQTGLPTQAAIKALVQREKSILLDFESASAKAQQMIANEMGFNLVQIAMTLAFGGVFYFGTVWHQSFLKYIADHRRLPIKQLQKMLGILPNHSAIMILMTFSPKRNFDHDYLNRQLMLAEALHLLEGPYIDHPLWNAEKPQQLILAKETINALLQLLFYQEDELDLFYSAHTKWDESDKRNLYARYRLNDGYDPNKHIPLALKKLAADIRDNAKILPTSKKTVLDVLMGPAAKQKSQRAALEAYLKILSERGQFHRYDSLFPPVPSRSEMRSVLKKLGIKSNKIYQKIDEVDFNQTSGALKLGPWPDSFYENEGESLMEEIRSVATKLIQGWAENWSKTMSFKNEDPMFSSEQQGVFVLIEMITNAIAHGNKKQLSEPVYLAWKASGNHAEIFTIDRGQRLAESDFNLEKLSGKSLGEKLIRTKALQLIHFSESGEAEKETFGITQVTIALKQKRSEARKVSEIRSGESLFQVLREDRSEEIWFYLYDAKDGEDRGYVYFLKTNRPRLLLGGGIFVEPSLQGKGLSLELLQAAKKNLGPVEITSDHTAAQHSGRQALISLLSRSESRISLVAKYEKIVAAALKRVKPDMAGQDLIEIESGLSAQEEKNLDGELKQLAIYFAEDGDLEKAALMFWLIKDDKTAADLAKDVSSLKGLGEDRQAMVRTTSHLSTSLRTSEPRTEDSHSQAVSGPKARILISRTELGNMMEENFLAFYKFFYQNQELELSVYGSASQNPEEETRVGLLEAVPSAKTGRVSFFLDQLAAAQSGEAIEFSSVSGTKTVRGKKIMAADVRTVEGMASGFLAAMGMEYIEEQGFVRVTSGIEISRFFEFLSWQVFAASA